MAPGPNSFDFIQFLGKFRKIVCSPPHPPPRVDAPTSRKFWIRHWIGWCSNVWGWQWWIQDLSGEGGWLQRGSNQPLFHYILLKTAWKWKKSHPEVEAYPKCVLPRQLIQQYKMRTRNLSRSTFTLIFTLYDSPVWKKRCDVYIVSDGLIVAVTHVLMGDTL